MRMNHSARIVKPLATPAHLGWRIIAIIYDAVIAIALLMISSAIVIVLNAGSPIAPGSISSFFVFLFFWIVIGVYAILSWRAGGQTLGMRPWRLKVLNTDGKQPNWNALCIRYIIASGTLGLGAVWSLFDKERRALYDIASGTLLVRLHPIKSA